MVLYNKSVKLNCLEDIAGSKVTNEGKCHKVKNQDTPPIGWLKWNTDTSRIGPTHTSTVSYVCRDNTIVPFLSSGKNIGHYLTLTTENLKILEAVITTIQQQMFDLIIESDWLTIQAIIGDVNPPVRL